MDDEPDAVEITETMLSEIGGLSTISAYDGESGLELARTAHPDLIILDIQMPGINGFEVFTELKKDESTKTIQVIMLTVVEKKTGIGFSTEDMKSFLGISPEAYIEKPVDAVTLQQTVSRLLEL